MEVPTSSGPASVVARLVIAVPDSAPAGATVRVQGHVEIVSDAARIITVPGRSRLLIAQDGQVVGGSYGAADPEVPLVLRAGPSRPAQALPDSLRLTGVGGADLPPGDYCVVGVLAYGRDALDSGPAGGAGRAFALVSAPVSITVR